MRRCRDPLAASRVAVPESVLGHVGVLVLTPACAPWLHVLSCALAVVQLALFRALKIRSQGLGGRCVVRHCNAGDASSSGGDDECTFSGGIFWRGGYHVSDGSSRFATPSTSRCRHRGTPRGDVSTYAVPSLKALVVVPRLGLPRRSGGFFDANSSLLGVYWHLAVGMD